MTPLERKYLSRKPAKKTDWNAWFADILLGAALGLVLLVVVLVLAGTILTLTPGVRAEEKQDNAYWCAHIAERKANVAPEDRKEVTSYCAKYL